MATRLWVEAKDVKTGDFLPGLDNGYVFQDPETGGGYLTYPSTGSGYDVAMPDNTVVITYHDSQGDECYLILPPESVVQVER